jgi:hypothetical protein
MVEWCNNSGCNNGVATEMDWWWCMGATTMDGWDGKGGGGGDDKPPWVVGWDEVPYGGKWYPKCWGRVAKEQTFPVAWDK